MYFISSANIQIQFNSIQLDAAAYSKVDGNYNPFVRPDPIHICKIHEVRDLKIAGTYISFPLKQFHPST